MNDAPAGVDILSAPAEGVAARGRDRGRRRFLRKLYEDHWQELCHYLAATFGAGPPEPEDAAQAAFAKFAALDAPRSIANPRAYLYTVARNFVIDELRRAERHGACERELERDCSVALLSDSGPERVLLEKERFAIFAAALARMPATRRRMVLLNRFEGLTCAEIGRRFGMSGAAVQKQISRALAACLREMDDAIGEREA
ncbi:MAG: RNA polymerase sigma factor [Rhodothalassiaceae bacterium]